MHRLSLLGLSLLFCASSLLSQSKITFEDRQQLLTADVKTALQQKFIEISIDYTNLVDFTNKCDYYFAAINQTQEELVFTIKNCDDVLLGTKTLSSSLLTASTEEQVIVYFYNLKSIIYR